jgi:transposase
LKKRWQNAASDATSPTTLESQKMPQNRWRILHRVRSRLVSERTAVINQIRGFLLERGIVVRQGLRFLRQQLPDILAKRTEALSPRMVRIVSH